MKTESLPMSNVAKYPVLHGPASRIRGFSLIEIIIVLVIVAIIGAIGAPSFGQFLRSNKISATTNDLVGALYAARSEAITRGVSAVVCPSDNSQDVDAVCGAGVEWTSGFIAFVDDNGNGTREPGAEDILVQVDQLTTGFGLTPDVVYRDRVYFSNDGSSTNLAGIPLTGQFLIELGDQPSRQVTVSANGRVSSKSTP